MTAPGSHVVVQQRGGGNNLYCSRGRQLRLLAKPPSRQICKTADRCWVAHLRLASAEGDKAGRHRLVHRRLLFLGNQLPQVDQPVPVELKGVHTCWLGALPKSHSHNRDLQQIGAASRMVRPEGMQPQAGAQLDSIWQPPTFCGFISRLRRLSHR